MTDQAADKAKSAAQQSGDAAEKAHEHPALKNLARVGYVVTGLLHILIGYLAIRIALGSGGGEASNSGAIAQIAQAPGGQIALWVASFGLAALGLWRLLQVFVGPEMKDRAQGAVLGLVYLSLAFTAGRFAAGGSTSDGDTASSVTATVLDKPAGVVLVVLAGLVVLGVGLFSIYTGVTKGFKEHIESHATAGSVGTGIVVIGQVGYIGRGAAFTVLGGMIMWAALTHDPEKAAGLDAALRLIGEQPFGMFLLILVGVGLAMYGVFCIARAKYIDE